MTLLTSPFEKGGLRGIFHVSNPPSPPFAKGGYFGREYIDNLLSMLLR
jgi:hypothetical protein